MTEIMSLVERLSPGSRRELRSALDRYDPPSAQEGVAIVGMACRIPGDCSTPAAFWTFLAEGGDGVVAVPTDRSADGEPWLSPWGGFLSSVDTFDAAHFGIAPHEAQAMDPQQRLLLELSAEAFAHASLQPHEVRRSNTGVFVGLSSNDYLTLGAAQNIAVDAYTATGNPHSVAVGRVSYTFDLRGPCLAIDTACSSSMVALDAAFHSLRSGRCDRALAGGVHLMLDPRGTEALSSWAMLSPEGKCKPFDCRADGFVRGEGGAVFVLKRLSDAERDGDRVWAVLAGTAVNQDGRSNGLTAPNVQSQEAVMRDALRVAGVEPWEVTAVETHGTGTVLGDPVEFDALSHVYGQGPTPCQLGAVKSNIGHLEAASGAVGLLKATLCVAHEEIPPNLHFTGWNPTIHVNGTRLQVPTSLAPLPAASAKGTAVAVSSFGFGGTNAHAILLAPPAHSWPSVLLFPGQGGQFRGMGRRFLDEEPAFADRVDQLEDDFAAVLGFSLRSALRGELAVDKISQIQPVLCGFQLAAAAFVESRYGTPIGVIGHSMGEVAAAVVADLLSPAQGFRIIATRSHLMESLGGHGAMAVANCAPEELEALLDPDGNVTIAALNSPTETVIAGPADEIDRLIASTGPGLPQIRPVKVDVASHSAFVDPVLRPLMDALAGVEPAGPPRIPIYSTSGVPTTWDAAYWAANLRNPVRLVEALEAAFTAGATRFFEISPHPVLQTAVRACGGTRRVSTRCIQVRPPDWRRQRYWLDANRRSPRGNGFFDADLQLPGGRHVFQVCFGSPQFVWLQQHRLFGTSVAPAAALLEAIASAATADHPSPLHIQNVTFTRLVPLDAGTRLTVTLNCDGEVDLAIEDAGAAVSCGQARIAEESIALPTPLTPPDTTGRALAAQDVYKALALRGQDYGDAFTRLSEVRDLDEGWVAASILPVADGHRSGVLDTPQLDAALQMMSVALPDDGLFVPVSLDECCVLAPNTPAVRAVGRGYLTAQGGPCVDVDLIGARGESVVLLRGLHIRRLGRVDIPISWNRSLYKCAWVDLETSARKEPKGQLWNLSGPDPTAVADLTAALGAIGADAVRDAPRVRDQTVLVFVDDPGWPLEARFDHAKDLVGSFTRAATAASGHGGAVTVVVIGPPCGPMAMVARSLTRTAALESPAITPRLVIADDVSVAELASALTRPWRDDIVHLGPTGARGLHLARLDGLPESSATIRPEAAYVVTGGMGGIGLEVTRWLLDSGAGRVIANGRHAPDPGTNPSLDALRSDPRLRIVLGDISDPAVAARCVEEAQRSGLVLRGVLHLAGVVVDRTMSDTQGEVIEATWDPKARGALQLHAAVADADLDFFVVFSSAAAVLGSPGQSAYVSANAAAEAVCAYRRTLGLPGSVLQWGRWRDVGLAAGAKNRLMEPMAVADGLTALGRYLAGGDTDVVVARLNPQALLYHFPEAADTEFFAVARDAAAQPESVDIERLRQLPVSRARAEIHEATVKRVAALMGYTPTELATGTPLTSLGIDSLMAVRISRAMTSAFGVEIGVSSLLQGSTVSELAELVANRVLGSPDPAATSGADLGAAQDRASRRAQALATMHRRD